MAQKVKTVSVINWKGGVGKTTLTYHLAVGLQHLSCDQPEPPTYRKTPPKVLLVDADAQCSLCISCLTAEQFEHMIYRDDTPIGTLKDLIAHFLESEQPPISVRDYILPACVQSGEGHAYAHIDLLPSHPDLIYTDMNIAVYSRPNFRKQLLGSDLYKFQLLDNILNTVKHEYDFIFIDCPPNLNYVTQNALYASDYYLIPTIPDKLSSYGILSIIHKVNDLNKMFRSAAKGYTDTKLVGIVLNHVHEYANKPKGTQAYIIHALKDMFPTEIFENYLTYGDGIPKSSAFGYPVFALARSHSNSEKQSQCVKHITSEFLNKLGKES
ncbi:ParA family protein [Geobacillus jurassicus]|uniref:ParA family protein n=1 Tax=Geobacillus jurassicus TaxID=235932 RepID=A0ABV6GVM7_9BACL|nr:ParA family protein [Geobacillus jurassicus]